MTENTKPKESEQSYQLPDGVSRRDLIRAGGATVGVAAAGGIPAATGIEQPVGEAQALISIGSIAAVTALGLPFWGAYKFVDSAFFDQSASDVADSVDKQTIYSDFDTALDNQEKDIGEAAEKVGVDNSSRPQSVGDNLVSPKDNSHVNTMVSDAFSSAAQEYQNGGDLAAMKQAAKETIKIRSSVAEIGVIGIWNELLQSLSSVFLLHHNSFGTSKDVLYADVPSNSVKFAFAPGNTSDHEMAAKTGSSEGILGVRDISSTLPISTSKIPDEDLPNNGVKIIEPFLEYSSTNDSNNQGFLTPTPSGSRHDIADTVEDSISLNIVSEYQSSIRSIKTWKFEEILSAIYTIYNNVMNDIDTNIARLETALDSGDVVPEDFVSTEDIYDQFDSPGSVSRSAAELLGEGVFDFYDKEITVEIKSSGETHTGVLFLDVNQDFTFSEGQTIKSSAHNGGYIIKSSGDVSIPESSDITIQSISGDKDSVKFVNRPSYRSDGVSVEDMRDQTQLKNERYQELRTKIEELESDDDGLFGGGAGGDLLGGNGLLIGGAALVAAYLLGR